MKTARIIDWWGNPVTKQMPRGLAKHLVNKKNKKAKCNSQLVYLSFN